MTGPVGPFASSPKPEATLYLGRLYCLSSVTTFFEQLFFLKPFGCIEPKFYVEPLGTGGPKFIPLSKMATMPICRRDHVEIILQI